MVNPTKIQKIAATCRFGHWDNPAASDSNPVTPVFYFGWRQPSDGLVDSDGEALLWHLEDCVLRMDEILQEARDMRVVFDLRDVSAKNVWSVVGMGGHR